VAANAFTQSLANHQAPAEERRSTAAEGPLALRKDLALALEFRGSLGVNCNRFQTTAAHMYLSGKAFGDKCASQGYNSEEFQ
jgi:hypothetical protein